MLVDNITLLVKAGNGGNGAATFLRNSMTAKGGPNGGNGGNGGNIYFQGSNNITDLRQFRYQKKITALDGIKGKQKNLFGKNAPNQIIFVPLGTSITDLNTQTVVERTDTTPILIARGGIGGRGNNEFKSATNQTPVFAEKGTLGEEKKLLLELKLIANIGLIGLPNAGKSSLLAALTNATPKLEIIHLLRLSQISECLGTILLQIFRASSKEHLRVGDSEQHFLDTLKKQTCLSTALTQAFKTLKKLIKQ